MGYSSLTASLEAVLESCRDNHYLDSVSWYRKNTYLNFLHRQEPRERSRYSDYTLGPKQIDGNAKTSQYFDIITDKLLLFSYLIGRTEIKIDCNGTIKNKKIKRICHLYMLRPEEEYPFVKNIDSKLADLLKRVSERKSRFQTQGWSELIDELGADEKVVQYLGREINYQMVLEPYPRINAYAFGERLNHKKTKLSQRKASLDAGSLSRYFPHLDKITGQISLERILNLTELNQEDIVKIIQKCGLLVEMPGSMAARVDFKRILKTMLISGHLEDAKRLYDSYFK